MNIPTECLTFMRGFEALQLATADKTGKPEASYAPFILDEQLNFYIYISGLAKHTKNLMNNAHASILLLEPEATAHNPFARKRLTLDCAATEVIRDSEQWQLMLQQFTWHFGDIMQVLRDLTDFRLFRLQPQQAYYVKGFGQAYRVDMNELMTAIAEVS